LRWFFCFSYINFRIARARRPHIVVGTTHDGRPLTFDGGQIAGWMRPAAAVLALMFALSGASNWLSWLTFLNAVPFGDRDPIFGRDVSFYIFRLPIWESIREQLLTLSFSPDWLRPALRALGQLRHGIAARRRCVAAVSPRAGRAAPALYWPQ
jgi:hypothetical protein